MRAPPRATRTATLFPSSTRCRSVSGSAPVQPALAKRLAMKKLALSLAAMLLPLSAAAATEPAEEPRALGVEASIVFPSDSSIRNWRADRGRGIWIQDRKGDWYYGTFAGYCREDRKSTSLNSSH